MIFIFILNIIYSFVIKIMSAKISGQSLKNTETNLEYETLNIQNLILPEPLSYSVESINSENFTEPGALTLTSDGKLLRKYLTFSGFTRQFQRAYDKWLNDILPGQITNYQFPTGTGVYRIEGIEYRGPYTDDGIPILPKTARDQGRIYDISVYGELVFYPNNPQLQPIRDYNLSKNRKTAGSFSTKTKNLLGKFPLMLGTHYCHLHGKPERELIALGECVSDPFGYFIINGSERFIKLQEKLRLNKIIMFFNSKFKTVECQFTSNSIKGPKRVRIIIGKFKDLQIHLPFLGSTGNKLNTLNLYVCFRLLGMKNIESIENLILSFVPESARIKARHILTLTRVEAMNISNDYESVCALKGITELDYNQKMLKVKNFIADDLFPHIFFSNNPEYSNYVKCVLLAQMSSRILEYLLDLRELDDRDSFSNKRIESAAVLMEQLFTPLIGEWVKDVSASILDQKSKNELERIRLSIQKHESTWEKNLKDAFSSDNWGVKGSKFKQNVTDSLKRDSVALVYSQLTTINTPTSENNRITDIRLIHPTQTGYICIVETPEGEKCGLVKNLALTSYPSVEFSEIPLISSIENYKYIAETAEYSETGIDLLDPLGYPSQTENSEIGYTLNRNPLKKDLLTINGIPRGWCNSGIMYRYLRNLKLGYSFPEMAIIQSENCIEVYTDSSRLIRPLLVVDSETGKLVLSIKKLDSPEYVSKFKDNDSYIAELFRNGALEYLDCAEQEMNAIVAQSTGQLSDLQKTFDNYRSDLKNAINALQFLKSLESDNSDNSNYSEPDSELRMAYETYYSEETIESLESKISKLHIILDRIRNTPKFTHCEIDPGAILGITASLAPIPNFSHGPRSVFQAKMTKQAEGIYHSNGTNRFDTTVKTLAFPSRPMFETQISEFIGLNRMPIGQTVKVAIMNYGGYNIEDGIIFNQSSIDMGLFTSVKYITISVYESSGTYIDKIEIPKNTKNIQKFAHLEPSGLPKPGTRLEKDQVVVAKTRVYKGSKEVVDVSETIGIGEEGIVDRVLITKTVDNKTVAYVKIRQLRIPRPGDKFCAFYSQKSTMSLAVPPEDLPFIASGPDSGTVPDVIISPYCFTGDTRVSLSNGLSMNIKDMPADGGFDIWSFDTTNKGFTASRQYAAEPKGVKDILQITLSDGRTLKCTHDHKILTKNSNNEYVYIEARNLLPRGEYKDGKWNNSLNSNPTNVVVGLENPLDEFGADEVGWKFHLYSDVYLEMNTYSNRYRVLAFARLLGYMLSDGCLCIDKRSGNFFGNILFGHIYDVESARVDIYLLTGIKYKFRYDSNCYIINYSGKLGMMFGMLKNMIYGRRTMQPEQWPDIVLDPKTPKSFIREFLAGLFGGDGHSPYTRFNKASNLKSKSGDRYTLERMGFSQSVHPNFRESMILKMTQLQSLLSRFGVETDLLPPKMMNKGKIEEATNKLLFDQIKDSYNFFDEPEIELENSFKELNISETDKNEETDKKTDSYKIKQFLNYIDGKVVESECKVNLNSNFYTKKRDLDYLSYNRTEVHEIKFKPGTDLLFHKHIGVRYCIQKALKTEAACAYWRYIENVKHQHDFVIAQDYNIYMDNNNKQIDRSRCRLISENMAKESLYSKEAPLNEYYSLPNRELFARRRRRDRSSELKKLDYNFIEDVETFFTKMGVYDWFIKSENKANYIVKQTDFYIRTFNLEVVDIRPIGKEEVYDISVERTENFFANGVSVHNCISGRMTCGMLIEIIASKVAALRGERINASAFSKFEHEKFASVLRSYGFDSKGNETMISGLTGKQIKAQIFVGPCYFANLGKDVIDKIQVRGYGNYDPTTHEAVRGRTAYGGSGLRIGELESATFIAHGTPNILRDRLNFSSDGYRRVICKECGYFAINDIVSKKFVCRFCKTSGSFGTSTFPTTFKFLIELLSGANIGIRLGSSKRNIPISEKFSDTLTASNILKPDEYDFTQFDTYDESGDESGYES